MARLINSQVLIFQSVEQLLYLCVSMRIDIFLVGTRVLQVILVSLCLAIFLNPWTKGVRSTMVQQHKRAAATEITGMVISTV